MDKHQLSAQNFRAQKVLKWDAKGKPVTYIAVDDQQKYQLIVKQMLSPPDKMSLDGQQRLASFQDAKNIDILPFLGTYQYRREVYVLREFINAHSLRITRRFHPDEVKAIAIALLEVLAKIQHQVPGFVHGNIKPENIFFQKIFGQETKLVLTDFALSLTAPYSSGFELPGSEKLGLTPLEQMVGNATPASDNYAVGAIALSLLSGTPISQLDLLVCEDNPYRYRTREVLLKQHFPMSSYFVGWLDNALAPEQSDRFPDARTALYALRRTQVVARPHVRLSPLVIHLQAEKFGEQLQASIQVSNLMPGTVLMGKWRVTPLFHDSGEWIQFHPERVIGNDTISLSVATQKLLAGQQYFRELVFQSNGKQPLISVSLIVKTADLSMPIRPLPIMHLAGLLIVSSFLPIALKIVFMTGP